ncbi:MAG: hypothetical protein CR982_05105 [Candidatus Cloacimonadota bacterium]|nr:MAG: hypothetical protein CR982_05105 [Candidatus Cloacimonadota bacterium]PIE78797.1 MAG: hypothetical protein CSA15_05990 [Candidatus Delongbacteria bacterium]
MDKKLKKKLKKFNAADLLGGDEFSYQSFVNCYKLMEDSDKLVWKPDSDVYTSEGKLIYCLSIPFVDPNEISIIMNQNNITIKGERRKICNNVSHYYKMNLNFGHFEIKFNIPVNIDRKSLTRTYKDGFYFIEFDIV